MPAHNLCAAPAKSVADQRPFFRMDSRREYIDQVAVYFTRYLRTKSCLMPSTKFDIIDASAYISPSDLVFVILSLCQLRRSPFSVDSSIGFSFFHFLVAEHVPSRTRDRSHSPARDERCSCDSIPIAFPE